jgi:DNA-binding transcriptional MerR regulator
VAPTGTYTAEKLAFRAGVPLRTVRFYIQEKLIDPPLGRGPGAHFTDHHLVQLQQARTLQNAGFSLEAIRERSGDLSVGLQAMAGWAALRERSRALTGGRAKPAAPGEDDELDPADCLRIPMIDGVELMVSRDRALPSPRQLVEIALYVRKVFGSR